MTRADRRLAALAAAFAPARATVLLDRLVVPCRAELIAAAARLAAAPRPDRLAALAVSLSAPARAGPAEESIRDAAACERHRTAEALRIAVAGSEPDGSGPSPVLLRLCRERLGQG